MNSNQLSKCKKRLEVYLKDLLESVGRSERRKWGSVYVRGLLLDGKRKSIEPMADRLPDGNIQSMQQFIGQSPWNNQPIRQRLAERMSKELIPAHAWIIDDTGFPKKGEHSVGVARQYSGTLGKIGNCQIAVSLHLATEEACMPLNYSLYLPESWFKDPERMRKSGIPDETTFKTKWELALDLIDETLKWDIPRGVVICDTFYGKVNAFRDGLANRELLYLCQVESKTIIYDESDRFKKKQRSKKAAADSTISIKEFAKQIPSWHYKTIRWRDGTKGKMVSNFAVVRVQPAHGHHAGKVLPPRQWLLIDWPTDEKEPTKYWFSNLNKQVGLRRLVKLAMNRWQIEQNYQQQKDELGLDHYEGRGLMGWHHHVTMNMIAFGFLLLEKLRGKKKFWVEPADDQENASKTPADMDGDMPGL